MHPRYLLILCAIPLFMSASAKANELGDCSWEILSAPKELRVVEHAKINIIGNKLFYTLDAQDLGGTSPIHNPPVSDEYQILKKNDVGIVAGLPRIETIKGIGPIVSTQVLLLNRANGGLKIVSTDMTGAADVVIAGQCKFN